MGSIIGGLIGKRILGHVIGERGARAIAYAGLIAFIFFALWGAKCAYDANLIRNHDANQGEVVAKADRKADNHAAEQRLDDVQRVNTEAQQIKEAVNEARNEGRDPRAAYYECVRLQQAARREHKPPPEC